MRLRISLTIVIAAISFNILAQVSEQVAPRSFGLVSGGNVRLSNEIFHLPDLDNNAEIKRAAKIKNESCTTCRNDFFGRGIDVNIDIKKTGRHIEVSDGTIWILEMGSNTAKSLQFHFTDFYIPERATLHIYSHDHDFILGAFTNRNNTPDGKFATALFPGNTAVIEYFEPKLAPTTGVIHINRVIHTFNDANTPYSVNRNGTSLGYGNSGSCTINSKCTDGGPVSNESKAVALISAFDDRTGLSSVCSGFLINSTDDVEFKKPFFMTAGHCITQVKNRVNAVTQPGYYFDVIFYFNYESSSCSNQATSPLTTAKSFQGAYLRSMCNDQQSHNLADYALFELVDKPEDYIPVTYLGWDRRHISQNGTVYNISHPFGDAKKIAIGSDPVSTGFEVYSNCLNLPMEVWRVDWNIGVTQPVSSGSPLLNSSKRVIGSVQGGVSRCSDSPPPQGSCSETIALSGPDFFSRMDYSWNHPAQRKDPEVPYTFDPLSSYLDKTLTNQLYIDSYTPTAPPPIGGGWDASSCIRQAGDSQGIRLSPADDFKKWFGCDVAISGNYIVVGAYLEKKVYIYKIENCTVNLKYELSNSADKNFGFKVGISGNNVIVGGSGYAYIYKRTGESWDIVNQFTSKSTGTTNYGCDVAISSTYALVGAKTESGGGTVYFYKKDTNGTWSFESSTSIGGVGGQGYDFGETVELSEKTCVIGATGFDNDNFTGAIYIYKLTSSWIIDKVIQCPNCQAGYNFGSAIALSDNDILVSSTIGAQAWSYTRKNGDWVDNGKLTAAQGYTNVHSVALSNQLALVGDIGPQAGYTGMLNIFQRNSPDQKWKFLKQIAPGSTKAGDYFGFASALTDSYMVIGTPESQINYNGSCAFSGSAFVYDLATIGAYSNTSDINLCSATITATSYNVSRSIILGGTSSCNVVFNSGSNAGYFATNNVLLKQGVLIKSGAAFLAKTTTGCASFNNASTNTEGRMATSEIEYPTKSDFEIGNNGHAFNEAAGFSLIPNPTNGICKLLMSEDGEQLKSLKAINSLGQQSSVNYVRTEDSTYEIDLSEFSNGIYLMRIETDRKQAFLRVIKK
jgi:hypothetical protein